MLRKKNTQAKNQRGFAVTAALWRAKHKERARAPQFDGVMQFDANLRKSFFLSTHNKKTRLFSSRSTLPPGLQTRAISRSAADCRWCGVCGSPHIYKKKREKKHGREYITVLRYGIGHAHGAVLLRTRERQPSRCRIKVLRFWYIVRYDDVPYTGKDKPGR